MNITVASFLLTFVIFFISSLLYRSEKTKHTEYARYFSLSGFALLFILSIVLTIVFTIQGIFHIWFMGANMGILLMFNAFTRVWTYEEVSQKLTETTALFVLILMPFYIYPSLKEVLQEFIASHLHIYLNILNSSAVLMAQEPGMITRIEFVNGAFLYIVWACVGFEFVALYAAILIATDAPIKKRLYWIGASIVIIYVVNMFRLVATALIVEFDLIGPLFTSKNTVQMSYFLSESIFAQIFAIIAAMGLFIALRTRFDDVQNIIDGFLDFHPRVQQYLKEKLEPYFGEYF